MSLEQQVKVNTENIAECQELFKKMDRSVSELKGQVSTIVGQNGTVLHLIKYVVLPLIFILGALVGIKIF